MMPFWYVAENFKDSHELNKENMCDQRNALIYFEFSQRVWIFKTSMKSWMSSKTGPVLLTVQELHAFNC